MNKETIELAEPKPVKQKIKEARYASFFNEQDFMDTMNRIEFEEKLATVPVNLPQRQKQLAQEFQAYMVFLWATAARPNEIIRLKRKDFAQEGHFIKILLPASKGSNPRPVLLPSNDVLIKQAWKHINNCFPEVLVFHNLIGKAIKHGATASRKKHGKVVKKDRYVSYYPVLTERVRGMSIKCFGVSPYFFRHNRLTIAAEKLSFKQLKDLKGSKRDESVFPYLHKTRKEAKKISKELTK